jgi:hypothetical protein
LSELRVLVCGPAINAAESAERLEMLAGINLPNATKFVITTGKFDAEKAASTFNIEGSYPAEPAHLQTLARYAAAGPGEQCFRDGYDLFCFRRLVMERKGFALAVLLRNAGGFDDRWPELRSALNDKLFLTFVPKSVEQVGELGATNLIIDLTDERAGPFLERVGEVYASGASYAITSYSLDAALRLGLEAMELEEVLTRAFKGGEQTRVSFEGSSFGRAGRRRPGVPSSEPAWSGR